MQRKTFLAMIEEALKRLGGERAAVEIVNEVVRLNPNPPRPINRKSLGVLLNHGDTIGRWVKVSKGVYKARGKESAAEPRVEPSVASVSA